MAFYLIHFLSVTHLIRVIFFLKSTISSVLQLFHSHMVYILEKHFLPSVPWFQRQTQFPEGNWVFFLSFKPISSYGHCACGSWDFPSEWYENRRKGKRKASPLCVSWSASGSCSCGGTLFCRKGTQHPVPVDGLTAAATPTIQPTMTDTPP